ncbi:MAG: CNP1-like family protein [Gammaproteobacteria bacterium]
MTVLCLSLWSASASADDIIVEDGPVGLGGEWKDTTTPWREQAAELPAYPVSLDKLIELNVSTQGLPYRVYVDPASLATGEDLVVRFTTVMVSSSGVWNVTYEGLHCGERNFRRFAYGIDGTWRMLHESPWQPVSGVGINQYRKLLYDGYLCDVGKPYQDADELVRKLRYVSNPILIED